jgi:hypothetical protein
MPKQGRIQKLINKFFRVNEDQAPEKLGEGEIPLFENMVLDNPFGVPRMRGGFELLNNNVTANSIGKLFDIKSQNGTNYQLASINLAIQRSTGGAWTTIKTGLSSGRAGDLRMTAFGDDIIMVNAQDDPFRLAGDDLTTTTTLRLDKPVIEEVIIQREKNILADAKLDFSSVYMYALVYVTEVGERSNPSNPIMFVQASASMPQSTNATLSRLYLDNIPVPTDDRVVSKWLFRTEGWDRADDLEGRTFYLLKKLDIDTIDFEDNVADEDLDFSETLIYSRVPESAEHITQSNNRLWLANIIVHQKTFFEPFVVGRANGGDQTPTTIVYEDGYTNGGYSGSFIPFTDVPYAGGGGGNGGLHGARYYQYAVTYVDVNGYESEPAYGEVFLTGGSLGTYRDVVIVWVGVGGIGANDYTNNPELKERKIYRTEGQVLGAPFASGAHPFKLVATESIIHDEPPATTTHPNTDYDYFDDLADSAKDSGAGLGATYTEVTKQFKTAIAWSQVDRPAYFLSENIKQIYRDDQDAITGIMDDGNGVLMFKENSIVKLYHTGASQNWYLRKIWTEFGCDKKKSLVKIGSEIFFAFNKRPYSYVSGGIPKYIGYGKQEHWDGVIWTNMIDVVATSDWVCWLSQIPSDYIITVWDRKLETWYEFNLGTTQLTALAKYKYNTGFPEKLVVATSTRTFDYNEDATADDVSGSPVDISVTLQLPRIILDEVTPAKLRDLVMNFERVGAGVINLTVTTDDGAQTPIAIAGTAEGTQRITGTGGLSKSTYFDLKLTGYLQQLNAVRADLRPKRTGVGSI